MHNKRLAWWIAGALAVALLAGGGIAWAVAGRDRDKPAAAPGAPAPSSPAPAPTTPPPSPGADIKGPLDLLILGVDTRVSIPDWEPHADTIMLLHVDAGLTSGYLYSLPRDLRVKMPAFPPAGFGGGTHKLTEAMSRGSRVPGSNRANVEQGYQLLSRTLNAYTGIKQFQAGAILNFGGLARLTDQLGGIDLTVDQQVKSRHRKPDGSLRPMASGGGDYTGPQAVYQPGRRHLVGWQAIDYARQRYGLPDGDYDRTRHQRQVIKALLAKAASQDIPGDPARVEGIVSALGDTLVYVGGRRPVEYAYALRNLDPAKLTLVQLPGSGVGRGSGYRGEQLTGEARGFLQAVAAGSPDTYLAAHPKLVNKG